MLVSLALILDRVIGDPDWLWRSLPHPVVLFGKLIEWMDKNRARFMPKGADVDGPAAFWVGAILLLILLCLSLVIAKLVALLWWPFGFVLEFLIVAILIAQKSMMDHVQAVADGLAHDGLSGGRHAVSMIVGRDVSKLDESGVRKASIESLSENFTDGTVTPVFWYLIFGLPGLIFFKAVNTVDSMVGHRTPRHEWFGKAGAVLDDGMNWPAARLTAFIIWVADGFCKGRDYWKIVQQGASTHRSPNAGWPETGFAVSLGIRLGGPRAYGTEQVEASYLNSDGRKDVTAEDLNRAIGLFKRSCNVLLALCVVIALFSGEFFGFRGLVTLF